ncbi:putative MATE family efflux protein [Natranaerovirga pectinivora]|uniref:Multidrug export protein MepA n=1 Tax=Natranaerovirga pectinivora TaxID=682400 RepID=A0A4R3MKI0_9FIRM|nr:MATE family efflux transporter [Natranaerovirga pectinivora]TCT13975.1 putative MATE family efflux protein [Natranaerovirga pectinivora]
MKNKLDLQNDNIKKLFFSYLIPSICGTIVTSIYILVDTIMIGKGISNYAVAGLNIILPLFTLFFGTGLLFGVGGSVLLSYYRGKKDYVNEDQCFSTAVVLNILASIFYVVIFIVFFEEIIYFLGATDHTIKYITDYGMVFAVGIPFFICSSFLQTFLRNDKAAKLAMMAVVSGGILNILLDYYFIFVFKWGMKGAAMATVIGNMTTCIILLMHFRSKRNKLFFRFNGISIQKIKDIIINGLSTFSNEISLGIVIFIFNIQLLRYIGDIGVMVYGVIANTTAIATSLCNGISQAVQPIASTNYGGGRMDRIKHLKKLGLNTAFITGTIFCVAGLLFPKFIINIFLRPNEEIITLGVQGISIFFISFIGLSGNIFLNNFYQAVLNPERALLISLLRGVILSLLFVFILPPFLGVTGIWLAMPLAETITLLVAINKSYKNKLLL